MIFFSFFINLHKNLLITSYFYITLIFTISKYTNLRKIMIALVFHYFRSCINFYIKILYL